MTGDEVLAHIGQHVRDEQKDDAQFERVARGESAESAELAELEGAAAADPQLADRLAGSRPFEALAVDRIAARIMSSRAPVAADRAPSAKVVPIRRGLLRRIPPVVAPIAAAAAFLLYVGLTPTVPGLPAYTVAASGVESMRGSSEPTKLRLHAPARTERGARGQDARFEIVLRPATAVASKVVAYVFAVEGEEPSPVDATVEISPDGAVRIKGSMQRLGDARELRIVLGAPLEIGKFDDAVLRAKNKSASSRVHVVVVPIDRN